MKELRAIIQVRDQELGDASQAIDALTEQYWQSNALRDNVTEELMNSKTRMQTKMSHQQEQIRILSSGLNRIDFEREDGELLEPLAREVLREYEGQPCDTQLSRPGISQKEKQVMYMFYNGHDLSSVCSIAELPPDEIFRILQSLIAPPSFQLPDAIKVPQYWRVFNPSLADAARNHPILFSEPAFKDLCSCTNVQALTAILTRVFEDLSQREEWDWQPVVLFIMEMAANGAVYRRCPELMAELEEQIGDLKSVGGRLMRGCRTLKEGHIEYVSQTRLKLAGRHAEMQKEQEEFGRLAADMKSIISSDSEVRASVFREMIELALTSPYMR
jgi:hypothetical protein